ncbi:MAG: hypothetical protein NZO58_13245, partial [Gemmataceae bacterium]|nr:hypothetical protein [Gemmataceae bacterium]
MRGAVASLLMLALVVPLAALPEPTPEQWRANRRRFEQLRKQPEELARLRAEAEAFFHLDPERQQHIVRLAKALANEPVATQTRLMEVLDRYVDWYHNQIDDAARQRLHDARDPQQRLEIIRKLREDQWIADQPKALRDRLAQLPAAERAAWIAKEKAAERQRRIEWIVARNFWMELEGDAKGRRSLPTRLTDLPPPVQTYVKDYLLRMFLTPEEADQLAKTDGQWPQFPMKLVELADKHPAALPGPVGPKSISDLPPRVVNELRLKLPNPKKFEKLAPAAQPALLAKVYGIKEGKWPEF